MKRKATQEAGGPIAKAVKTAEPSVQSEVQNPGNSIRKAPPMRGAAVMNKKRTGQQQEDSMEAESLARYVRNAAESGSDSGNNLMEAGQSKETTTPQGEVPRNQELPAEELEAADRLARVADDLLRELILAVELRRAIQLRAQQLRDTHDDMTANILDAKLSERWRRLSELAVIPLMSSERSLGPLPPMWFIKMMALHDAQQKTIVQNKSTTEVQSEIASVLVSIDADIVLRTSILLRAPEDDPWPAAATHIDEKIAQTYEAVATLEDKHDLLADELGDLRNEETALANEALDEAESVLVKTGLLWETPQTRGRYELDGRVASSAGMDEQHVRTYQRSFDVPPAQAARYDHADRYPPERGSFNDRDHSDSWRRHRSASRPCLRDMIKAEKLNDLDHAARACSVASYEFHNVRRTYAHRLQDFLDACQQGNTQGSRTEFDAEYFLARAKAKRRVVKAESEFEHTKKAAQMVGALSERLVTSNFGDRIDDGYMDSELDVDVARLDKPTIERWRSDERQNDIEHEQKWEAEVTDTDPAAKSIAAESSATQDRYALGKCKKLIERWKAEQEEHRARERFRKQGVLEMDVNGAWRAFCSAGLSAAPCAELLLIHGLR